MQVTRAQPRRLPTEPLLRFLHHYRRVHKLESWGEVAHRLGVNERTLSRVITYDGLNSGTADRMALALGLHPMNLWPDEWVPPKRKRLTA